MAGAVVVHQGALGDLLLSLPAIRLLRTCFRPLTLVARRPHGLLLHELGEADRYLDSGGPEFVQFYSGELPRELGRDANAYIFARRRPEIRVRGLSWIRTVPGTATSVALFQLRQVQEALGVKTPCRRLFRPLDAKGERAGRTERVVIHPGSGAGGKCWPWERFQELVEEIVSRTSAQIVLACGPAEERGLKGRAERLAAELGLRLWSRLDLLSLAQGLAGSTLYVGNDSGITHLASWTGTKVVAVFGPTDPVKWAPPHPWVDVARPTVPCSPCDEAYRECREPVCMTGIGVAEVAGRVMKALCQNHCQIGP